MTNTLLVEGVDDQEVVRQLLRHHGFLIDSEDRRKILQHLRFGGLDVRRTGGYPSILEELSVYIKSRDGLHLGIVLDRDLGVEQQTDPWPSIRHRIVEAIPELAAGLPGDQTSLPKQGLIAASKSGRRVGVWVMPDNENPGTLETFVSRLVPPVDSLWPRAKAAVHAIPVGERPFQHKVDKACVHTWLAWQAEPGIRMGTAINNLYLDPLSEMASAFVSWIENLLSEK